MKLTEIIDNLERFLGGSGISTDENRWDSAYLESMVHRYSRMVIVQQFKSTKRIDPMWVQRLQLEYSDDMQGSLCYKDFDVPSVLQLDDSRSGLVNVGGVMCAPIRVVNSMNEATRAENHRITKGRPRALYMDGKLRIFNSEAEELFADAIFNNPVQVVSFNKETDEYPFSESLIPVMFDMIVKMEGQFLLQKPLDKKPDSADSLNTVSK